jgi:hypothetical protein
VRASAQAFLDLFRVRNFAAVPVDVDRMRMLENQKVDLQALLADRVETLKEPDPPKVYPTVDAAGAAAGFDAREPATLPDGYALDQVVVRGNGAARVTIDAPRLRSMLETLDLKDVQLPDGIDGQVVEVRVPPIVVQSFRRGERGRVELIQARSPEVSLPPGLDLARLGEIGLRVVGLSADEARRFSRTIDWGSTLLVPVPAGAGSFLEVEVRGTRGLLVTMNRNEADRKGGDASVLLWSEGDRVFGVCGNLDSMKLVQLANSLR